MATPEILDFAALLKPISPEAPAGAEPEQGPTAGGLRRELRDERDAARKAERDLAQWNLQSDEEKERALADGERSPGPPNWEAVWRKASDNLAHHFKDLWVAAWGIEALARLHGFAGLRDGFRLARQLVEQFWDGIHPRPQEEDQEEGYPGAVEQLVGLNGKESQGTLIRPIEQIPITEDGLTSADYESALAHKQMEAFERAAAQSSPEFFRNRLEDIQQAEEEFARLSQLLDAKCGTSLPSSAIRGALEQCRSRVMSLAKNLPAPAGQEGSAGSLVATAPEFSGGSPSKPLMTREDAFRALLQVAETFRRTEPHSPVSYALEQAVRWGRMSLPELLRELIPDDAAFQEVLRRTGIPKPKKTEDS